MRNKYNDYCMFVKKGFQVCFFQFHQLKLNFTVMTIFRLPPYFSFEIKVYSLENIIFELDRMTCGQLRF